MLKGKEKKNKLKPAILCELKLQSTKKEPKIIVTTSN